MKLKLFTAFIIFINVAVLALDIPITVFLGVLGILISSFLIPGKNIRLVSKIILLFVSMYILRAEYKTLLVTECGVSFVLFLSALKFWELETENDHFNMFLILFLSECSIFLIAPSFIMFFVGLLKMLFYFYYILKIRNYDIGLLNPRRLLILITPSIIFALLLFYTFPRFTQGFLNSNDLQYLMSGGSSQLKFNELGPINLSKEPIFKVYGLDTSDLSLNLLYWKSSVFWQISNATMSTGNFNLRNNGSQSSIQYKYNYKVSVSQNLKEYLPVLDSTSTIHSASLPFNSYDDGSFRLKAISRGPLEYSVSSNYGERLQIFNSFIEKKSLRLSSRKLNEVIEAYQIPESQNSTDEERFVELKKIFRSRNFEYSTTPPRYENLEDFLINGKQGYCTHFAFSFAYLARLLNIPSRVVMGYLGGEHNPYDNSLIVRELDGHAWTEVFLKAKGWVRVDPTSFVAPDRLKMDASEFNNNLDPYFTFLNIKISKNFFNFKIVSNTSLWISSLNSRLSSSIINFDREKQLQVLRSMTPKNFPIGWVFVTSLILSLSLFSLLFFILGRPKINPAEKRYLKFVKKMKKLGIVKLENETASQFVERCKVHFPKEKHYLETELEHFINSFYK